MQTKKPNKFLGWLKALLGIVVTGVSAYAEAGGKVPPGVTAGVAAAAVLVSHTDTSQGRAAEQAGR